uniref:Coiled-coil domain-containing protein n=1 Tax=Anoplophora glabripennis TaxID=217634 RepID=V5GEX1_ANOGL
MLHDAWRSQQDVKLEGVKRQYDEAKQEADDKNDELNKVEQKLAVIMKGIGQLFKLFRCSNDPLIKLLGNNGTINYYNVLLYLQILEQNIQKALVTVYHKEMGLVSFKLLNTVQIKLRNIRSITKATVR